MLYSISLFIYFYKFLYYRRLETIYAGVHEFGRQQQTELDRKTVTADRSARHE